MQKRVDNKMMTHRSNEEGFTLIELSIVLVIIGLIVGGILAGTDMIKAAEVRATIAQIEKYNTSVNTFRDKYRYIPGDITASYASQFGFPARSGAVGRGDGNRLLEAGAANAITAGYENVLFWRDLNVADLLDAEMDAATDAAVTCANPDACKEYFPEAKLGRGNLVMTYSYYGHNYFEIKGVSSVSSGTFTTRELMTPQEAFNIDDKIDDGKPLTGAVRATEGTGAMNSLATAATAAAGVCVEDGNSNYNTATEAYADSPACGIRIKMQ